LLILVLLVVIGVHLASTQDSVPRRTSLKHGPDDVTSVTIQCDGRETLLGLGGDTPIKITFVMNDELSGCSARLDCPDVAGDPVSTFPPDYLLTVFGCETGRMRLTSLAGSGNLILDIGGAD
jgi:hypothetical protein